MADLSLLDLILMTNLFLSRSYTYRSQILFLFGFLVYCTDTYLKLILISISRRSYRTYAYTEVHKNVWVFMSISDLP